MLNTDTPPYRNVERARNVFGGAMVGFLVLHAWGCTPESVGVLVNALTEHYPGSRVLVPAASGNEWFAYLTNREGAGEDLIDSRQMRWARYRLLGLVDYNGMDPRDTVVIGISQGGCMALELSAYQEFAAVITVVSHLTYVTSHTSLLCPWFALVGSRDSVFPPRAWAGRELHRATKIATCPFGHHVPCRVAVLFVLNAVRDALEISRCKHPGGVGVPLPPRPKAGKRPVKRSRV
jgi:predicted esterase